MMAKGAAVPSLEKQTANAVTQQRMGSLKVAVTAINVSNGR